MKKVLRAKLRRYDLEDGGLLLEVGGELLIYVPEAVPIRRPLGNGEVVPSCDIEEGTTRKGRRILRLRPGDAYCVSWQRGAGDRTWCRWGRWPDHPEIWAWAGPTSRGGGCWWEVWVFPARFRPERGGLPGTYGGRPDAKKVRLEAEILEKEIQE